MKKTIETEMNKLLKQNETYQKIKVLYSDACEHMRAQEETINQLQDKTSQYTKKLDSNNVTMVDAKDLIEKRNQELEDFEREL